jgi:hypothetical protein
MNIDMFSLALIGAASVLVSSLGGEICSSSNHNTKGSDRDHISTHGVQGASLLALPAAKQMTRAAPVHRKTAELTLRERVSLET